MDSLGESSNAVPAAPILLLHLSDFHFKNNEHPVLERAEAIVVAVQSLMQPVSAIFVVVTGDIAYAGLPGEYELADAFFKDLIERLCQLLPGIDVRVLFAPGNHDCDLSEPSDIRDYNLLKSKQKVLDTSGSIFLNCVAVQKSYFDFARAFGQQHANGGDQLARRFEFVAGQTQRVGFTVYNSAWLSQNPERQGQLFIPESAFLRPEDPADIEVAFFHHTCNWLDPDNATTFRLHLEKHADIVLSGHQHRGVDGQVADHDGNSAYVIEAMAMHDARVSENGFNVVLLDPQSARWQLHSFAWDTTRYAQIRETADWAPFLRNKALEDGGFANTPNFRSHLTDPGIAFTHGTKREIYLPDIFVYPDLTQRDIQRKIEASKPSSAVVRSKNVLQWIHDSKRVLLTGEDKAGRTALAKTLYRDLQRNYDLVPILLTPDELDTFRPQKLRAIIESAYIAQYGGERKNAFFDLPSARRVLIIDDLHRSSLSHVASASLILNAEPFFDFIVIIIDGLYDIEVLLNKFERPLFGGYRQYSICEMGHQLRARLITRWVTLHKDHWTTEGDCFQEILEKEKILESLLARRMLPSYPLIILGMLQFLEAGKNPHASTGSYGELYQLLITDRLARIAKKPSDIGTWYTLLARLAFSMFSAEKQTLTRDEFRGVYLEYYAVFKIHYDVNSLCDDFIQAQILEWRDGNLSFKYRDFYHFFVARYFDDNIQDSASAWVLRGRLQEMAERVYFEEYASIIVFYLYLSKDQDIIHRLLDNARKILSSLEPCDLENDTAFLNKMYITPPGTVLLPEGDPLNNREAYRARMDELESNSAPRSDGEKLAYSDELDDIAKITIALKSIYILGQVLRAFPGAIKQELKTQIARECYLLGLRVLSLVVNSVAAHEEELRNYFALYIRDQRALVKAADLPSSAEEVILNLMHGWVFGVIKGISTAVGLAELDVTYREVMAEAGKLLSVQLIDLSIRLDHFYEFPKDLVETLRTRVRGNLFSYSILRDLLVYYFMLFRSTDSLRRKYGKMFGIETQKRNLLEPGMLKPAEE